jgi:hypothetical protein
MCCKITCFIGFLLYLSLLIFVNFHHGILILKSKRLDSKIRQWPHFFSIALFLAPLFLSQGSYATFIRYSLLNTLLVVFGRLSKVLVFVAILLPLVAQSVRRLRLVAD